MTDLTPEAVKAALDAHEGQAGARPYNPTDCEKMAPTLAPAYLELAEENERLRKPEHAAASILASGMGWIVPVVLNAVDAERAKWEANPMVKRGEVPPETITLAMFEACLRALAAYRATEDGK